VVDVEASEGRVDGGDPIVVIDTVELVELVAPFAVDATALFGAGAPLTVGEVVIGVVAGELGVVVVMIVEPS